MKKLIAFTLAFALAASFALPASAAALAFHDWVAGTWYEDAMEYCVENGVFTGSNGKIEAGRSITRAEFITVLVRYFDYSEPADISAFKDVSADDWFHDYVAIGVRAGITNGVSASAFSPRTTVTREQAITMYVRALDLEPVDTEAVLAEVPDGGSVSSWARSAVAMAVSYGIVSGNELGEMLPGNPITRAETAQILYTTTMDIFDGEVPLAELPQLEDEDSGSAADDTSDTGNVGNISDSIPYIPYADPREAAEQQRLNDAAGQVRIHVDTDLLALVEGTSILCTITNYAENGRSIKVVLRMADGSVLWQKTLASGESVKTLTLERPMPPYGNYPVRFIITPDGAAGFEIEAMLYVAYLWG